MIATFSQIQQIILRNPNRELISNAKAQADKLMMHVFGIGLNGAIDNYGYFENKQVYEERKKSAISNRDLFARLLQREEMVFSAQGGAAYYDGLNEKQTVEFDATLDNIRFNSTIRDWVKNFALLAYRTDPMGVLFIELSIDGSKAYPTYKSIACIYDYLTDGRKLEYICFKLTAQECIAFGIEDESLKNMPSNQVTSYYRFVDDSFDYIILNRNGQVTVYDQRAHPFKITPGIIASDIIDFKNTQCFESPLKDVIELADTFLVDRSIRNLTKKYSGFPKSYEPLLDCGTCGGTKYVAGAACPDCTLPGTDRGTGYKLQTQVSDVARFPIDPDGKLDPQKYFGYISPDVKVWDKQDTSLNDIENFIRDVYWGTYNRQSTTGPTSPQSTIEETATKTLADLQPIYARLNQTADWAESTENALCNFIGTWKYESFKSSLRTYGRYYILETPDELIEQYLEEKGKGAPQAVLTETLIKYYHSLYSENKVKLAIQLKLMEVEPFVHYTLVQVQAANPAKQDYVAKMYFSEWLALQSDTYLLITDVAKLTDSLNEFVGTKTALAPELLVDPNVGVTETVRNTQ